MRFALRAANTVAALVAAGAAAAQPAPDANARHVRSMAATCAACHGTDGAAVAGEAMPALAGYPKPALVAQLKAFRDGTREATVMHQIARGYTDDEIDAIATYFATRATTARGRSR